MMTEQHTPLTPEDWIAKGYKQFKSTIKPLADFGLQKRFDDENGKRYFITVWVYDNSAYMDRYEGWSMWSFQPDVQFKMEDGTTFDVVYHHTNNTQWGVTSIDDVEAFFYNMWEKLGCQYYEKWSE